MLRDLCHRLVGDLGENSSIVSLSFDKGSSRVFVLLGDGTVLHLSEIDDFLRFEGKFNACVDQEIDNGWFYLRFIAGTGSAVAISHSGSIVSIEASDVGTLEPEQIGCIDGGIASASWSPDQSFLTIITNNNTMLCMSSTWDVLQEIPMAPRLSGSTVGKQLNFSVLVSSK